MTVQKNFSFFSSALVPFVGCGLLLLGMIYQSQSAQPLLTQMAPTEDAYVRFPADDNKSLLLMAEQQYHSYQFCAARERKSLNASLRYCRHQMTVLNAERYNEVIASADPSVLDHTTLPHHLNSPDD